MEVLGCLIGTIIAAAIDIYLCRKYGYPSLSILHALCYKSKYFKWMSFCIWGDCYWYYDNVLEALGKSKK